MPVVWKAEPEYRPAVDVVRTVEERRVLGLDRPGLLYNEHLEPRYSPKGKRA